MVSYFLKNTVKTCLYGLNISGNIKIEHIFQSKAFFHISGTHIFSALLTGSNKKHLHLWLNGPELLWKFEIQWPKQNLVKEIQDDDSEVKRKMKVHTISIKEGILERLESLISNSMRMKRVVAWIFEYKKI